MSGKANVTGLMLLIIGLCGYLCDYLVARFLSRAGGAAAMCGLKGLQTVIGNAVTVLFACLIILIVCMSSYAIWEGMIRMAGLPELELKARSHPGTIELGSHSSSGVLNEARTPDAKPLIGSVDTREPLSHDLAQ